MKREVVYISRHLLAAHVLSQAYANKHIGKYVWLFGADSVISYALELLNSKYDYDASVLYSEVIDSLYTLEPNIDVDIIATCANEAICVIEYLVNIVLSIVGMGKISDIQHTEYAHIVRIAVWR